MYWGGEASMTQILPEHSQNWKSRPGWTLAGAGAAVVGPVPARSWQRGRAPPEGAASSGGAGRGEQAELRDRQGGAALGACRSSEAQEDDGGAGRWRRRWVGAAALGGHGSMRGQGHGSTRRPPGT